MEKTRTSDCEEVRMLVLVGSVVGTMGAISMPAHAEQASVSDEKAPSAAVRSKRSCLRPRSRAEHRPFFLDPTPTLTAIQLEKFAELIGEPQFVVSRNLQADPRLIPYAAAAADVRVERKSTGKIMTIVGFSILGVGAIAGYVIMLEGITQGLNCGDGLTTTPATIPTVTPP